MRKIFFKLTRDLYPQIKDRVPYLYMEYGRIEIDDSSVKWISCENEVIRLPIALVAALLLGPGTSITHEAVKAISSAGCLICWVGAQSLHFYAYGMPPTAGTEHLYRQMRLAVDEASRVEVARRMFAKRFPGEDLTAKSLPALMGMEGNRVKKLYAQKAKEYGCEWVGRRYIPGQEECSNPVNRVLTFANSLLYGVITSAIVAHGYSPRIGFVHSGSPLPFVYDMADLYKEFVSIDLAFSFAGKGKNPSDRKLVIEAVLERMAQIDLVNKFAKDIEEVFGGDDAGCYC